MDEIAKALNEIANAIHRFSDIYVAVNLPDDSEQIENTASYLDGTRQ